MHEDLEQEYKRTLTTIVWIGYILLCLHFYTVGHPYFINMNLPLQVVDRFIVRFNHRIPLFSHSFLIKGIILLLLFMRYWGDKNSSSGIKAVEVARKWLLLLGLGTILFWGSGWIGHSLRRADQLLLYISLTTAGFVLIKQSMVHLVPLLGYEDDPDDDSSSDWRGGRSGPRGPKRPKAGTFRQVKRPEKIYA